MTNATDRSTALQGGAMPVVTNMTMLGEIVWLMAHSSLHRGWPVDSILQWVVPALLHKQCRLYHRDGRPVAYVAWAGLSRDVEEAYVLNPRSLQPKDWCSGKRLWMLDWIAPYGDSTAVIRDLKEGLFKEEVGRALRVKPGSNEMRIIYLYGANARLKSKNEAFNPTVDLKGAALRAARQAGESMEK